MPQSPCSYSPANLRASPESGAGFLCPCQAQGCDLLQTKTGRGGRAEMEEAILVWVASILSTGSRGRHLQVPMLHTTSALTCSAGLRVSGVVVGNEELSQSLLTDIQHLPRQEL